MSVLFSAFEWHSGAPGAKVVQPLCFNIRTPANNGHGPVVHENTVWAGVECLAVLVYDFGLHLPPAQVREYQTTTRMSDGYTNRCSRCTGFSPAQDVCPQRLELGSTLPLLFFSFFFARYISLTKMVDALVPTVASYLLFLLMILCEIQRKNTLLKFTCCSCSVAS